VRARRGGDDTDGEEDGEYLSSSSRSDRDEEEDEREDDGEHSTFTRGSRGTQETQGGRGGEAARSPSSSTSPISPFAYADEEEGDYSDDDDDEYGNEYSRQNRRAMKTAPSPLKKKAAHGSHGSPLRSTAGVSLGRLTLLHSEDAKDHLLGVQRSWMMVLSLAKWAAWGRRTAPTLRGRVEWHKQLRAAAAMFRGKEMRTLGAALNGWSFQVSERLRRRGIATRIAARMRNLAVAGAWAGWAAFVDMRKENRAKLDRALRRMKNGKLARILDKWKEYHAVCKQMRFDRLGRFITQRWAGAKRACFMAIQDFAAGRKHDRIIRKCLGRAMYRCRFRCWEGWRLFTVKQRNAKKLCRRLMMRRRDEYVVGGGGRGWGCRR
jgi:hypothetical protein